MGKRIALLVLVGMLAVAVNGFALKGTPDFAIGAEVTTVNFAGVGGMMTLHIPSIPLFLGLGASFTGGVSLAGTADYWLMHDQLVGMLEWYMGLWRPDSRYPELVRDGREDAGRAPIVAARQ